MSWVLLVVAGLFEVTFAICLGKAKKASGIVVTYWYGGLGVCCEISMILLIKSTKVLPIGAA